MPPTNAVRLRGLSPDDYSYVIARLDEWWGGRAMSALLPRLFFDHFHNTSFAAVDGNGETVGFLVGFLSPADPTAAYVHFIGVDPRLRGQGVGRRLHHEFAELAAADGRTRITAVTSPENLDSITFHTGLGFSARLDPEHDGPGRDLVVFERSLS